MARHRRKDAEGATLMTRKRLWKDSDGRVVNRPAKEARKIPSSATTQAPDFQASAFPPSPPKSASGLAISPSSAEVLPIPSDQQSVNGLNDLATYNFEHAANDHFFWDTSLQPVYDSSYSTGPFDDIFAPDTASSFNMPYTTMNNYNWLFDLNLNPSLSGVDTSTGSTMPTLAGVASEQGHPTNIQSNSTQTPVTTTNDSELHQKTRNHFAKKKDTSEGGMESTVVGTISAPEDNARDVMRAHQPARPGDLKETPMLSLYPDMDLPQIDDISHERVLDIVEMSRPTTPDGSIVTVEHPLLSLASLQAWLDLFFFRFNTVYPLIHVPTFDPSESEPVLLLPMLLLGATYADKDSHQLAVCIHDVARPQIFSNPGFTAKPELWVLQATLLTECLGKSRAGQKQHDMSHLFHGLLINLIRRSDCQSIIPETEISSKGSIDVSWKAWAISEQKKRLAQLCFVWDVQHAVLFSQSLCMSAFELRSTLPCQQNVWEARSATEWQNALKQRDQRPPLLLTALKDCLTNQYNRTEGLNLLGHVVLLHGLMSISWDMARRDQTSLGLVGDKIASGSWKDRMKRAYDNWKIDFDAHSAAMRENYYQHDFAPGNRQPEILQGFETYIASYSALYHAAQLTLTADILDLQIYAGARHILGRPVSKIDYIRSQKVVKAWASDDACRAAFAAWHAAQVLRESLTIKLVSVSGDVFHHPWILFLANLAVWTFYQANKDAGGTSLDDEMIWDVKDDMKQLLQMMDVVNPEQLTAHRKISTAGLTAVVVKHLSKIRWGVIHDGMLILRGLVQWRLINDEDSRA